MARILVAYGSQNGSTAEISARIGGRLADAGFDTDVLHANLDIDVRKYDALVVGSPMYGDRWMKDPTLLLVANHERLGTKPLALFSVGLADVSHPDGLRDQHDDRTAKAFSNAEVRLRPIAEATFNGVFWRSNLPWLVRIVDAILRRIPEGDHRDWGAIDAWADEISREFIRVLYAAEPNGNRRSVR